MTQREVILDRIGRIELSQRCRNVASHAPSRTRVARQPQAAADANDVRIERNDQLGGRDPRPNAEIQRVVPNHPAEEEIEALASAAGRRLWKEIADTGPAWKSAVRRSEIERQGPPRKTVQRPFNVFGSVVVTFKKKPFHRS